MDQWDFHDKTIVCVIIGHGLKDTLTGYDIQRSLIKPDIYALKDVL